MSSPDHSRDERLQIMLSAEELVVLDDFRFKTRMPSRAAAVRELLKRGLAAEGFPAVVFGRKSADYGVTGASPSDGHANGSGNGRSKMDGKADGASRMDGK
jgi:hypothetical protein